MRKLLLATNNQGKIREIKSLLADLPFDILTINEVKTPSLLKNIQETGATFSQNASIKAKTCAAATQLLTLADDSGLKIDALGGQPGIQSARFVPGPDATRYSRILKLMKGIPHHKRTARFKAAVAIHNPQTGDTTIFEGKTEGWITTKPRGTYGFGYDPIFYSAELGKTFGEAGLTEKNRVSHRARALRQARAFLCKLSTTTV